MPGLHWQVYVEGCTAGLPLALGSRMPWLTGRGHYNELVQKSAPPHLIQALSDIHRELGGDALALANKRPGNPPTPDLVHLDSGCLIEVDEVQHFTSARLRTFEQYPDDIPLGFDVNEYRDLVKEWRAKADRAFAHKVSSDFPQPGGRQAQRAYFDSLRDLLAPTFTGCPVIRLPVPGRSILGMIARLQSAMDAFAK